MSDVQYKRTAGQLFTAYIEYMKLMLGNLFVINGGSAIAMITFFGNYKPDQNAHALVTTTSVQSAVVCFAFGAVAAIVASGVLAVGENNNAYMVEREPLDKPRRYHVKLTVVGVVLICASIGSFFLACYIAVHP
jgi:hypothetical protein